MDKAHCVGIIPARYGSIRFPGKPLVPILGKTLIQHTYENAKRCPLFHTVVVATDDKRIFNHVKEFGGETVMTSTECQTGSDRLAEAYQKYFSKDAVDIIVNVQGDEPCLEPFVMQRIIEMLRNDPLAVMSTAITKIHTQEEAENPSVVKCVLDSNQNALYFSRSLIPGNKSGKFDPRCTYYKHIGIYAYRSDFLLAYTKLQTTPLQKAEDLEQLKVLEHGYRIKTAIVDTPCVGVDTPDDIQKVEKILCKQSTYSLQAACALR